MDDERLKSGDAGEEVTGAQAHKPEKPEGSLGKGAMKNIMSERITAAGGTPRAALTGGA